LSSVIYKIVIFCSVYVLSVIVTFMLYDCICFWYAELNMIQRVIYWIMSSC